MKKVKLLNNTKSKLTKEVLEYIIAYIVGESNHDLMRYVKYSFPSDTSQEGIYIIPSGFFDAEKYMIKEDFPNIQAVTVAGISALFGEGKMERHDEYIILYADIIATSFFLISRYEEYIRRDCRDVHGRFIGKESVLYRTGLLQEPILDQYGELIRKLLSDLGKTVINVSPGFNKILLTHDIDIPWTFPRGYFSKWKTVLKEQVAILLNRNKQYHQKRLYIIKGKISDPANTFDYFIEEDTKLKLIWGDIFDSLYFLMVCKKGEYDFGYIKEEERTKELVNKLQKNGAKFGIHISYQAGADSDKILKECKKYKDFMGENPKLSRYHYLMCREPEDFYKLMECGITDDFSCCYADGGGFRFGSCRPVRWIDPVAMKVTNLTMHPLFATEGKLCRKEYMGMSFDEAVRYLKQQIDKIKKYHGEVVVLFHNTSVSEDNEYKLREIYLEMVNYLRGIYNETDSHL